MHPGDRKSRPPARVQNARCNLTGTADHPNSPSAFRSFPGSVSLEARATGTFLGRLAGGVSVTRRAPRMAPLMKSKLIMEIPPKLKEYLDNNRSVYAGNNRGSLPSITDPGEPLQLDSLNLIRLVAFFESDFGYRIEDEELRAENFATLRTLGELLATKTPTGPTGEANLLRRRRSIDTGRKLHKFASCRKRLRSI